MVTAEKSISALWQDYLFLTQEMNKFLDRQDHEMFLELLMQREHLQSMIEEKHSHDFTNTKEGQDICKEIVAINSAMADKVQYALNMHKQNKNLSRAYDGLNNSAVGIRMDWKS